MFNWRPYSTHWVLLQPLSWRRREVMTWHLASSLGPSPVWGHKAESAPLITLHQRLIDNWTTFRCRWARNGTETLCCPVSHLGWCTHLIHIFVLPHSGMSVRVPQLCLSGQSIRVFGVMDVLSHIGMKIVSPRMSTEQSEDAIDVCIAVLALLDQFLSQSQDASVAWA